LISRIEEIDKFPIHARLLLSLSYFDNGSQYAENDISAEEETPGQAARVFEADAYQRRTSGYCGAAA